MKKADSIGKNIFLKIHQKFHEFCGKKNQPEIRKKKDPKIFTRDDFSMNLVLKKCLNKVYKWINYNT